MSNEYKLSYTASEIDAKLKKVDEHNSSISNLSEKINDLNKNTVNWLTCKDSCGTYTYAINEKLVSYDIAQTIKNTSFNGSLSALEDIVSWTYYLHNSWWSDVEVSTAKGIVDNYKALKDGNAFISGKSLEIYYQEPLNKIIQDCIVITESSLHGATHLIQTVGGDVDSCIYYNSDNNTVTHWESSYKGVTKEFTMSGKSADAKAVGDALDAKITTPESGSIGQVLAVKEVDENGKPVEWEAVDMSTDSSAATDEDVINNLIELNVVNPIANSNNEVYMSNDGKLYCL